jgi:transaldolase
MISIQMSTFSEESALDQLKKFTVVVADTGEFASMIQFSPQDATTNPSLILKAAQNPAYLGLIDAAVDYAIEHRAKFGADTESALLNLAIDKVACNFVNEISKIVPGFISVEVDARLSFDTEVCREYILRCTCILRFQH